MGNKIVILIVLAVLAVGGYFAWNRFFSVPTVKRQLTLEELMERDRKNLADPDAKPEQISEALYRLSRAQDPEAKRVALEKISDPNSILRAAAALASGFYEDSDSLDAVKKGLADDDQTVRLFALRGLGEKQSEERVALLKAAINDPKTTQAEKTAAYESLAKIGSTQEKQEIVGKLVKTATAGDGGENNEAAFRVAGLAPEDPRVIEMLKNKIKADTNKELIPVAIRHLSSLKDPWVTSKLKELSQHSDWQVRAAAIGSLHETCVPFRWELLDAVLEGEKDANVLRAAFREAVTLRGAQAKAFLQKAVQKVGPELKPEAQEAAKEAEKQMAGEVCPAVAETKE